MVREGREEDGLGMGRGSVTEKRGGMGERKMGKERGK